VLYINIFKKDSCAGILLQKKDLLEKMAKKLKSRQSFKGIKTRLLTEKQD
jgi:hypothetical protein